MELTRNTSSPAEIAKPIPVPRDIGKLFAGALNGRILRLSDEVISSKRVMSREGRVATRLLAPRQTVGSQRGQTIRLASFSDDLAIWVGGRSWRHHRKSSASFCVARAYCGNGVHATLPTCCWSFPRRATRLLDHVRSSARQSTSPGPGAASGGALDVARDRRFR